MLIESIRFDSNSFHSDASVMFGYASANVTSIMLATAVAISVLRPAQKHFVSQAQVATSSTSFLKNDKNLRNDPQKNSYSPRH